MDKNIFRQIEESLECAMGRGQIIDRDALNFVRGLQVQVPFYVAEWYEQHINIGISDLIMNLIKPMDGLDRDRDSAKVFQWFKLLSQDDPNHHEDDLAVLTLTRMYLFGYEVQEWN